MRVVLLVVVLCAACSEPAAEVTTGPATEPVTEPATTPTSEPATALPTEETLCPPLADGRRRAIGGRPRALRPERIGDPAALARTVPESIPVPTSETPWQRTELRTTPEGHAGHLSASAHATLEHDGRQAHVFVVDLVHACVCDPGDGARLRDLDLRRDVTGRPLELDGRPALVGRERGELIARVWVAECCRATVRASSEDDALEVARGLDLEALYQGCRTGGSPWTF